jgi:hypothetical protein
MLSLDGVQAKIRDGLLGHEAAVLETLFGRTAGRFAVHRRHFVRSLTGALEKTFPAVVSLTDPCFFAYAADAFIRANPPASPCLFEYGGALPDFLDAFPACETVPYIGDVARFEWALHQAFHAPDASVRGAVFRPSVFHVASRWPVYAIWRVATDREEGPVDASAGPDHLLVYRAGDNVFTEVLDEGEFAFQHGLSGHGDLGKAAAAARAAYPDFDEAAARRRLTSNPNLLAVPLAEMRHP